MSISNYLLIIFRCEKGFGDRAGESNLELAKVKEYVGNQTAHTTVYNFSCHFSNFHYIVSFFHIGL